MRVGNTWWGRGCKKDSNKQNKTTRVIDGGVIRFVWGSFSTFSRFSDSEPEYLVKRDKDDIIIDLTRYLKRISDSRKEICLSPPQSPKKYSRVTIVTQCRKYHANVRRSFRRAFKRKKKDNDEEKKMPTAQVISSDDNDGTFSDGGTLRFDIDELGVQQKLVDCFSESEVDDSVKWGRVGIKIRRRGDKKLEVTESEWFV